MPELTEDNINTICDAMKEFLKHDQTAREQSLEIWIQWGLCDKQGRPRIVDKDTKTRMKY